MVRYLRLLCLAAAIPFAAELASASIERLTLRQMVEKADHGIFGEIVGKQVSAVVDASGEEHYYTTLTIAGRDLYDGAETTASVAYRGGFLDEERGVWNAEAPSDDDTAIGNRIVAFYKWSDDMGGGFASNALYAAHGGLFRTFENKQGVRVVQGRGVGYAVPANRTLTALETDARDHRRDIQRGR